MDLVKANSFIILLSLKLHCRLLTLHLLCSSLQIIDSSNNLGSFSRSITVPKEAFEKSVHLNVSVPFAAVLRFNNLATVRKICQHHLQFYGESTLCIWSCYYFVVIPFFQERTNSDVLGNEVLAIEMGTIIGNLTEKISINFRNMKHVSKTPMCIIKYVVFILL